tara:strand:+ start:78114 stop:78389 length:276 start_codon:yes stop_codon:yes gene_type:complete
MEPVENRERKFLDPNRPKIGRLYSCDLKTGKVSKEVIYKDHVYKKGRTMVLREFFYPSASKLYSWSKNRIEATEYFQKKIDEMAKGLEDKG